MQGQKNVLVNLDQIVCSIFSEESFSQIRYNTRMPMSATSF